MGDVSDIAELLPLAKHDVARQKIKRALKTLAYCASTFGGAAWGARGYMEQFATKEYVDLATAQQNAVHKEYDARFMAMVERQTRTETRVDDIRGTMVIRR